MMCVYQRHQWCKCGCVERWCGVGFGGAKQWFKHKKRCGQWEKSKRAAQLKDRLLYPPRALSPGALGSRLGCYCNHPPLVNSKREKGKRVTKSNLHKDSTNIRGCHSL